MKISAYTYVKNAVEMDYPFAESIESHLKFADEVVVVDASDKSDGTKEILADLKRKNSNLKLYTATMNWKVPNYGVYDGVLKQVARTHCTGDFLWQFDSDELVHEKDRLILEDIIKQTGMLQDNLLLCLPVVEYWGGFDKVRIDVNPWKWRLSKNHPEITHGIPISHREIRNGLVYAKPGTDGCDYIVKSQGLVIPSVNFYDKSADTLRQKALQGDEQARLQYEAWFNQMVNILPSVYHMSWFSIKSKMEKYRDFFGDFWKAMYGDNRSTNMFFKGVDWKNVTPEMIEAKAKELQQGTGGHIFHTPWPGTRTPHIQIKKPAPEIIQGWAQKHPL